MPIDDRTEHLSLALPHRENALEDDVTRLRAALIRLDGFAGETKARLDDGAALLELAAALDKESGQRKAADRVLESAAQEALDGLAGLEGRMLESLDDLAASQGGLESRLDSCFDERGLLSAASGGTGAASLEELKEALAVPAPPFSRTAVITESGRRPAPVGLFYVIACGAGGGGGGHQGRSWDGLSGGGGAGGVSGKRLASGLPGQELDIFIGAGGAQYGAKDEGVSAGATYVRLEGETLCAAGGGGNGGTAGAGSAGSGSTGGGGAGGAAIAPAGAGTDGLQTSNGIMGGKGCFGAGGGGAGAYAGGGATQGGAGGGVSGSPGGAGGPGARSSTPANGGGNGSGGGGGGGGGSGDESYGTFGGKGGDTEFSYGGTGGADADWTGLTQEEVAALCGKGGTHVLFGEDFPYGKGGDGAVPLVADTSIELDGQPGQDGAVIICW